ncbi:hypothetical protein LOTGIDRAFT_159629 [Lottia gigantea]|uniref:Fukutin n=1 Tax=Lottia gigantea TaxID=225164 RepID=V4AT44_LOTGI|nr:hypothetical protein LOTGIDRAFT_159629 [Lottia gigantea]ESO96881.1 hypothetical protein LOTGIDRAFT_159629 [Lottia gigantea]
MEEVTRGSGPDTVDMFDHLKDKGFNVYYSAIYTYSIRANTTLPAHFLIYHKDAEFLFHVVVFYKRHKNFMWCDKLQKEMLIEKIKQDNLKVFNKSLSEVLDKLHFGKYAFSFKSINTTMGTSHNINFLIPENGEQFLKDYREPEFIECNYTRANFYYKNYEISKKLTTWMSKAVKMIEKIGEALDKHGVPFTIAEGTLLGWYRQCGIITHTTDLDVLILRKDYTENILKSLKKIGFSHTQTFGKLNDSYEYSFRWSGVKLDVFFAYKENDTWWLGGTNGKKKLRFTIPKFKNCWSELMGVRVRVPCNAGEYIKKSYGENWYKPIKKWNWASDATNSKVVGRWKRSISWIKRHCIFC